MPDDPQAPLRRVAPDRYSDFELVGKGGMGVVYLALDSELNRRVAFKIVLPESDGESEDGTPKTPLEATPPRDSGTGSGRPFGELKARFLQEAWVTSGMEHPGIVPVYELGETDEGVPYYTMRYVRGERTMKEAIAAARDHEERLFLLEPFLKVCDTIRYAHARGVVHRDIKPENIAIGEFGEVIVLDWGLAKVEGRPDVTTGLWQERIEAYRDAGNFKTVAGALGTPGFMAPEAALGRSEEVDAASDVYSLGALLFCILTGRLPFRFESFLEYVNQVLGQDPPRADAVDPTVPRELADAVDRALSREKGERFQDVDDLARAVRVWQTEGPIEREIRSLLDQARDEVEAAKELEGNLLLLHLDRATSALNRIVHLQPDRDEALRLQAQVKRMRERGIRARVRTDRLAVLQRVAAGLLCIGAIVALVVFSLLNEERRRAEESQRKAENEIDVADRMREVAVARADRSEARAAAAYAAIARSHLEEGRNGAGRLVAAAGLTQRSDTDAWRVLAEADGRWTPTLLVCAFHVHAQCIVLAGGSDPRLLIGDDEGQVHEIGWSNGERTHVRRNALAAPVTAVTRWADPNGAVVAAGGADGRIAILAHGVDEPRRIVPADLPEPPETPAFEDSTLYRGTAVTALAPGPLPGSLLAGYADGRLRLFDADGALLHVAWHHTAAVTALVAQGSLAYTASADGSVNRWQTNGLILDDSWNLAGSPPIAGLRVGADAVLDVWTRDGSLRSLDSRTGAETPRITGADSNGAPAVLLDRGRLLASAGHADHALRFLESQDGALRARACPSEAPVLELAGSSDGTLLAVGREDDTVRVWDVSAAAGVPSVGSFHPATGRCARTRPDGTIEFRMLSGADPLFLGADRPERTSALAFDSEGGRLLSVSLVGGVTVWDVETGERIRRLRDPNGALTAVAWAQGEGRLLTGDVGGVVRFWHWPSGRPLSLPDATGAPILAIAAETPAYRVAAADAAGAVTLWDSDKKQRIRTWRDVGRILALAVSPAGERMAAIRDDGAILLCDGSEWTERGRLPPGAIALEVSLDADGTIRWVDRQGRTGTGTKLDPDAAAAPESFGLPWAQIDAEPRLRALRSSLGLEIEGFEVREATPEELPFAIDVGKQ